MLNFGWAEMMVIGVVALIVIGPEDLPDMFRQLGRFTAKLRTMSREFSRAMEQAAKDSGVKDVASDLRAVTSPKAMGLDAVKSAADKFEKWDPIKNAAKPTVTAAKPLVPPPMPAGPAVSSLTPVSTTPAALVPVSAMPTPSDEALDDLADADLAEADVIAEVPAHGPATQALYDKQALRAQVLAEQTAKLKAIEEGSYSPEPSIMPPPPAKKRVAKAKPADATDPAPKAPRKSSKKADQA